MPSLLQLKVQSVQDQIQAIANPALQEHFHGSSKLDSAVVSLLSQSQQSKLQGCFYGRLHSLAVVLAVEDLVAVNAVLKELCNLVSPEQHQ